MGQNMSFPHFFSVYQWGLIENAVTTLLGLFEELTREISSHTATASDVIPSVEALKCSLNKSLSTDSRVKTRKATLLEAVKHWFNSIYTEPLYFLATILDPKYKDHFFDQATKQQATEMLLSQLNNMTAPENSTEKERNESGPPLKKTCTESNGGSTSLLDMYGEVREENMTKEHQAHQTSPVGQQVNAYLSRPFPGAKAHCSFGKAICPTFQPWPMLHANTCQLPVQVSTVNVSYQRHQM